MVPQSDDSLTPPRRRWWHLATIDVTPLRRHRDFRLLFIGRFVSFFGSMITVVAFPYQVYQLTHSVLLVGLLGVLEFAAILAVAFVGGGPAGAQGRRAVGLLGGGGVVGRRPFAGGDAGRRPPPARVRVGWRTRL